MPLNKYGIFPNGRINLYNHFIMFNDVAILDFSTCGHGVFDYGNLSRLFYQKIDKHSYTADLNEIDLSLGQVNKAFLTCEEIIKNKDFKHIFIMPSSLSVTLGFDINALCYDIQEKYHVNTSTIFLNLNDDFYYAETLFYNYLFKYIKLEQSDKYNLIGDEVSNANILKHQKIKKILKEKYNLECMFDSLSFNELNDLHLSNKLNIITSNSALDLAKKLNIPYVFLNSLDEENDKLFFEKGLNIPYKINENVDYIYFQFKNIMKMTNKMIVCYLNIDHLEMLNNFFSYLDINIELIATHKNNKYKYMSMDNFIDLYKEKEYIVISNERVQKYLKDCISLEYVALDYKLLTPFEQTYIFYDDGIVLLEKLVSLIIK
mgnify:FL=1